MLSKRKILKTGGVIFGGLIVIGGIASETDYIDSPDDGNGTQEEDEPEEDADSTDDTTDETRTREILYDTTVEDRLEEEHEFSSEDVLHVEASINHEGRGVFTLNVGPGEDLRDTDIEDAKSFSLEIETDGTHIVNAIAGGGPDGRMELLVELETAEG